MADSRRINANIREEDEKRPVEEQPPFGVYAVILSSEFWPPFKDEKLEVPEDIREALEVYCKKYEKLKVLSRLPCGRGEAQVGCGLTWCPFHTWLAQDSARLRRDSRARPSLQSLSLFLPSPSDAPHVSLHWGERVGPVLCSPCLSF